MGEITVASTTDTQKDINTVAGAEPVEEAKQQVEQEEKPRAAEQVEQPIEERPKETRSAAQKRYDKLVRRINDLESELKAAKQPPVEEARPAAEAQPAEVAKPKPDDFKTWEEYTEALTEWKIDQREKDKERKAVQEAQEAKLKQTFESYNRQATEARSKYDDFDETLSDSVPIYVGVQMALMELDNGAEVAYYLGKHRDIAEKLMTMSEVRAMAEIGKLAATLGDGAEVDETPTSEVEEEEEKPVHKASPPPRRAVSQAPAPITPVGGSSTKSSVPLDELPFSEYRRIRDQQQKNRYRR